MAKTFTLKLAGLWPSPNDYTAKEGALDIGDNIVIDQTDLGESRRGFEVEIDNTGGSLDGYLLKSFTATAPTADSYDLLTYRLNEAVPEGKLLLNDADTISGDKNFLPTAGAVACRMLNWGKYIYVSTATGIKRYSVSLNSSVPAGIPQALDMVLSLTGSSGYLTANIGAAITATITSGSPTLSVINSSDLANLLIGQYITGTGVPAGTTISAITPSAIVVIQACTLTAGSAVIVSASNLAIAPGQIVTGIGIADNSRVVSISGGGPYNVTLNNAVLLSATGQLITFSTDNTILMSANATSGSPTSETITFSNGSEVAYRLIWGLQNENNGTSLGAPSSFVAITNTTGGSRNVVVNATIPSGITTDNFYQLFRSDATPAASITPADQMQLVVQGVPSPTDISNGFISITDQTPDSLKGEALYTGTDVEGILQADYPPPIAVDICAFRGYTLYCNYTLESQLKLSMDGVGSPNGIQSGDLITFTDGTSPFVMTAASSENISTGNFQVVTSGTPAQNIADTCASFIRVFNRYPTNTILYAYLLSGPNELPGQMLIQVRPTIGPFTVVASANGTAWTPDITSTQASMADNQKNAILVSKTQQPEAVPRVNLFRVGGLENEIIRAIPLRDYTVLLTSSGIYRMTGTDVTDFVVVPFDLTVILAAPETAATLGNECWCLSTQGVVSISDGGVRARSALQLNADLLALIRRAPTSVRDISFAVGYDTDQRYILALPNNEGDLVCSQQYCYNYIMDRWVRWTRSCTAGYVNSSKGLYLGNGNNTNIVKERKNGNYTDFVDESFEVAIVSFVGVTIVLSSVAGVSLGDLLWQDQGAGGLVYSEIISIDIPSNTVVVASTINWSLILSADKTRILTAIACAIQWKPNAAGDPSEAKQYSEGQVIFRSPRFYSALLQFATDVSPGFDPVPLFGLSSGGIGWGRFPWGGAPWGGTVRPQTLRFYIPQNKQYAGMLVTKLSIRSGYSDWQLEGIEIVPNDISFELGGPGIE